MVNRSAMQKIQSNLLDLEVHYGKPRKKLKNSEIIKENRSKNNEEGKNKASVVEKFFQPFLSKIIFEKEKDMRK